MPDGAMFRRAAEFSAAHALLDEPPSAEWVADWFAVDFRYEVRGFDQLQAALLSDFTGREGVVDLLGASLGAGMSTHAEIGTLHVVTDDQRIACTSMVEEIRYVAYPDATPSIIRYVLVNQLDAAHQKWERWAQLHPRLLDDALAKADEWAAELG